MARKWLMWIGVVCLVVGPIAQLAQFLVTPVTSGSDVPTQLAQVAADPSAMRWALALDVPLLLIIPAVVYVGLAAGLPTSRLTVSSTAIAFLSLLGGVFLVANDVLLYETSQLADAAAAISLVECYQGNAFVLAMLVFYLLGHLIGFPLLALALWRARVAPSWTAVALALFPVVEVLGVAGDSNRATTGNPRRRVEFSWKNDRGCFQP
jgi:hypothetical protein